MSYPPYKAGGLSNGISHAPLRRQEVGGTCENIFVLSVSREGKVVETRDQDWRAQKGRIMADGSGLQASRTSGSGDVGENVRPFTLNGAIGKPMYCCVALKRVPTEGV